MVRPQQFDLFDIPEVVPAAAAAVPTEEPAAALDDAALIAAIPLATQRNCWDLAGEAVRRRLVAAVPALEDLCRRLAGFGVDRAVVEQDAAFYGLAGIAGAEAQRAVGRIIAAGWVRGPGLGAALEAAVTLRCRRPADVSVTLLRHADPLVRADAARCAPGRPEVIALLIDLLDDLNADAALAAACALGRAGRAEGLVLLLRAAPSTETIDALAGIGDETCVVMLGRIAAGWPDLAGAAIEALHDIDDPRAAAIVARAVPPGVCGAASAGANGRRREN